MTGSLSLFLLSFKSTTIIVAEFSFVRADIARHGLDVANITTVLDIDITRHGGNRIDISALFNLDIATGCVDTVGSALEMHIARSGFDISHLALFGVDIGHRRVDSINLALGTLGRLDANVNTCTRRDLIGFHFFPILVQGGDFESVHVLDRRIAIGRDEISIPDNDNVSISNGAVYNALRPKIHTIVNKHPGLSVKSLNKNKLPEKNSSSIL